MSYPSDKWQVTNGIVSSTTFANQEKLNRVKIDTQTPPDTTKPHVINAKNQLMSGIKFLQIFQHANSQYSFDTFIAALSKWEYFCGEHEQIIGYLNLSSSADACKRELAAFFTHIIYNSN